MEHKIGMRIPPHFHQQGWPYIAEWAAGNGIEVIDVPDLNEDILSVLSENGLEVGSIDARGAVGSTKLLSKDDRERESAVQALQSQIAEVARLGGKILFMCLIPGDMYQKRADSFAIWKDAFPAVVREAEDKGVYLAIEGYPGPAPTYPTIGCTPEMIRAMLNAIPSKHFGINYDPSHFVRLGVDYLRALTEFGERVIYCHGKDTEILPEELYDYGTLPATFGANYDFSEGTWRYTIPGEGEVNWYKVAAGLDRFGYKGPISIELEDHRYWGSLAAEQKGIIKAQDHLASVFK
jgi:sugar phosphate isomerase/epimerase